MRTQPPPDDASQADKGRRFRLAVPLRLVMLALIPLAAWLGWVCESARLQRRARNAMQSYKAWAAVLHESPEDPIDARCFESIEPDTLSGPAEPSWLERNLGREYFKRIGQVGFRRYDERIPANVQSASNSLDPAFFETLKPLHELRELHLAGVTLDRRHLLAASAIPHLKTVELSGCRIDPDAFQLFARFPELERLTLIDPSPGPEAFDWSACSRAKNLSIRFDPESVDAADPVAFLRKLPALKGLSLRSTKLERVDLAPVFRLESLRLLDLSDSNLQSGSIRGLGALTRLESLNLADNVSLRAGDFLGLGQLRNLRTLSLGSTPFDDKGLLAIRGLPHLKTLNLENTEVTPEGLARIGLPETLERLKLGVFGPDVPPPTEHNALMKTVSQLHRLRELSLQQRPITDSGCAMLNGLGELRTLSLLDTRISDLNGLEPETLRRLEFVDASSTDLTSAGLATLCRLPGLKHLRVMNIPIASLRNIDFGSAANLETLELTATQLGDADLPALAKAPRLKYLDLSETQVTDDGIAHSPLPPNLEFLNLSSTAVTEKSLPILARLRSLRELSILTAMPFSDESVRRFRSARPDVYLDVMDSGANFDPGP